MIRGLRTLFLFYKRHLRVQPMRELMAVAGVAAGVALLFAVQINGSSLTGSYAELLHGVAGRATLEVAARRPEGFDERVFEEVQHITDIKAAAPVLETQIVAVGPRGSRSLTLMGATEELGALGGKLVTDYQRIAESAVRRGLLLLTQPTARALGVTAGSVVAIKIGERTEYLALSATISGKRAGPLAQSPVAAAPLPVVQSLAGLPGQITRILIEPRSGRTSQLRHELTRQFGDRLNVRSAQSEPRLLSEASAPENHLDALFGAISLVVGVVLAYNALLLASGERRRFILYLIELGTPDSMIVGSLLFDAFLLGVAGSILGLLLGDVISLVAYRSLPGYLTAAFPGGSRRIINWQTVVIAVGAGMLAAFAAAALPAISILRSGAEAEPEGVGLALTLIRQPRFGQRIAFAIGVALVCLSVAASLLWPAVTVGALLALIGGLVLCLPLLVSYMLRAAQSASRHWRDPSARLSIAELRSSPTRSVALVATGTIALFLLVQIGGSIADIQRAVREGATQTVLAGDLWVRPPGAENIYATQPFAYGDTQRRLEHVRAVHQVLPWRGSFLDLNNRRIWVIGVPPEARSLIAPVQLARGSLTVAERHLREGGWAVISQAIASEKHLRIGEGFALPTPSGAARLRLAATIYNYGWPSGTVIVNGEDYAKLWGSSWASQLAVTLTPGVSTTEGKRLVERALPPGSGLIVQTSAERQGEIRRVLGSTLSRLSDTTTVVLIAAIASVVAMMVAAVWQRRGRLDALMSMGMSFAQLARLVFYEGGSMLVAGSLIGLASGILAQGLGDNWADHITDTQVRFVPAWQLGLRTIAITTGISLAVAIVAVVRTVGFQPQAAFSTE